MYKPESIKKLLGLIREKETFYDNIPFTEIKMSISNGNSKIGKVMNVSLPPIRTCANCKECRNFCYDIKACLQYPDHVLDARMRNLAVLKQNRTEYFNRIEWKISRRKKNKYFRWHVAGDIVDLDYFANMVRIAVNYPDFIFWTYTKNYKVVNQFCDMYGRNAIPGNFHIMFSEWDGTELNNPYGLPVFTCKLKDGNKNHSVEYFYSLFKCPGNCDICKANNTGCIAGMNTYADEH